MYGYEETIYMILFFADWRLLNIYFYEGENKLEEKKNVKGHSIFLYNEFTGVV